MKILVIEPRKQPAIKEIPNVLEAMQKEVGGYIEAFYPFEENVCIICNEEGKLNPNLEPNRFIRDETGKILDVIYGTFFICGLGEENFEDIPEELIQEYSDLFEKDNPNTRMFVM